MIYLSPDAAQEVRRLIQTGQTPNSRNIRIGVQPGGCSDYSYLILASPQITPTDHVWDWDDIRLVVAEADLPLIDGMTLDYAQDLMGGGFRFHNPNATSSCGCGSSFAIASDT